MTSIWNIALANLPKNISSSGLSICGFFSNESFILGIKSSRNGLMLCCGQVFSDPGRGRGEYWAWIPPPRRGGGSGWFQNSGIFLPQCISNFFVWPSLYSCICTLIGHSDESGSLDGAPGQHREQLVHHVQPLVQDLHTEIVTGSSIQGFSQ